MNAFVVLNKNTKVLDGLNEFKKLCYPRIYNKLIDALKEINSLNSSQCVVMEFEFLLPEEIINAINNAMSSTGFYSFHIKWLSVYTKTNI